MDYRRNKTMENRSNQRVPYPSRIKSALPLMAGGNSSSAVGENGTSAAEIELQTKIVMPRSFCTSFSIFHGCLALWRIILTLISPKWHGRFAGQQAGVNMATGNCRQSRDFQVQESVLLHSWRYHGAPGAGHAHHLLRFPVASIGTD